MPGCLKRLNCYRHDMIESKCLQSVPQTYYACNLSKLPAVMALYIIPFALNLFSSEP